MLWPQNLNKEIKTKVNLAGFTSFKIGGPAKFFFEPQSLKELQEALIFAKHVGVKVFILGAGSNILVNDTGLDGLVIKLGGKDFKKVYIKGTCIVAASGLKLNQLILFAKDQGLSGLEFLSGIPGTLGGALVGNAGAWGKSIGELVREVIVLDYNGKLKLLEAKSLKFAYRESNLNKYIIIGARLQLFSKTKDKISAKLKEYLLERSKAQDRGKACAGCVFKNPAHDSAGKIIELCGLKGRRKGGAVISKLHANFILNTGKAKSRDVLSLMNLIRREAKKKFQVNLEPEIKIWK
jgi:UDP-N-acetylmuramate dehydrogenase